MVGPRGLPAFAAVAAIPNASVVNALVHTASTSDRMKMIGVMCVVGLMATTVGAPALGNHPVLDVTRSSSGERAHAVRAPRPPARQPLLFPWSSLCRRDGHIQALDWRAYRDR